VLQAGLLPAIHDTGETAALRKSRLFKSLPEGMARISAKISMRCRFDPDLRQLALRFLWA
jgi:hypothetical protein